MNTSVSDESYHRLARNLGLAFGVVWAVLAIRPVSRADWMLENFLLIPSAYVAVQGIRHRLFSRLSLVLIFVFWCLHEIGAHYTYSLVPYDEWWRWLTGRTFNSLFGWERNHFDRLVHFCYGLLLAYPIREIFLRVARVRGFWGYFLPLDLTLSTSAFYELLEWVTAEMLGGDLGQAYLGTQGDIWDAQKDMALAAIGALITILLTAWINWRFQRDFAREWSNSFRVRRENPK